ncbi:thioesterase II family protein [Micromonospora lupini]|uniref:thioesterase II family protein n=1 Tax=Micromonospora lupini TaxID=285679 RepID=UPI0033ECB7BC
MTGVPSTTDLSWFVPLSDPDAGKAHVYALPQVGGGCATFAACADVLAPHTVVWGVNLPGRQARFLEPPRTALMPLVGELADALQTVDPPPQVLFGYCSGALLAFLIVQELHARAAAPPGRLVVASHPAPDRVPPPTNLHTLPSDQFWAEIISYGGVSDEIAAQADFREIFEPALRGDYALLADYRAAPAPPLDLPITVVVGAGDPVLREDDLLAWRSFTTGDFALHTLDGDHWLLDTAGAELAALLDKEAQ